MKSEFRVKVWKGDANKGSSHLFINKKFYDKYLAERYKEMLFKQYGTNCEYDIVERKRPMFETKQEFLDYKKQEKLEAEKR